MTAGVGGPSRAVVYARVSTEGTEQDPAAQLLALRRMCAERGWRVVSEHSDRVSGDPARRGEPPGLRDALAQLQHGKADVLCVFAADRLVRSPVALLQLVSRVQQAGGRICSLRDGADLDTTTPEGELLTFLRGWFGRMELQLCRVRTRAGMARAAAEGRKPGRPVTPLPDLDQVAELVKQGKSEREMMRALGCKRGRLQRALRRLAGLPEWPTKGGSETATDPERAGGADAGG